MTRDTLGSQQAFLLDNTSAPPKTRGECADIERPCRRYSCRHHNWVEAERAGRPPKSGKRPPPRVIEHHADSCSLDVADRGPLSPQGVGKILGVTSERVLQIQARAELKLKVAALMVDVLDEYVVPRLPPQVQVVTAYPSGDPAGSLHATVTLVFRVPGMVKATRAVTVRKKT